MKKTTKQKKEQYTIPAEELRQLLDVIGDISKGRHSDEIMEFTKPDKAEGTRQIAEAIGLMMVNIEGKEFRLNQLIEELRKLNNQLKKNIIQTIITIAHVLGTRDKYTENHAHRVSLYAERLARRLNLPEEEIDNIKIGGKLHDIGKIGFSDKLFKNEDTTLTTEMYQEIRNHPEIGVSILKSLDILEPILDYVRYHHERINGKGYPYGLRGDNIPIGAVIVSIADCFDAITTNRPYQKSKSMEDAINILRKLGGKSMPKKLVELFIEDLKENGILKS